MKLFIKHFEPIVFENLLFEYKDIDFSLFVDHRPEKNEDLSSINILVLQEPNEYFGHHDWAIQNQHLFSVILTWDDKVLSNCNNALFLAFGSSWITDEIANKKRDKVFSVGHLCGELLLTYGHQMRHEIIKRENEIKTPKNFLFKGDRYPMSKALITKESIFASPMFAAVIENTCHNGYFTEKITDCMMFKTIPIYWGCSNIEKFYNPEGIISFRSVDEFIKICNNLTPEYYTSRLNVIEENYKKVNEYQNYENRICSKIIDILKYNNII
jgi:hypothetical protein